MVCDILIVTSSDKISLILPENISIHIMVSISCSVAMCYSNSVSSIELLRIFRIHGEVCAEILRSEKVTKLQRLKINSKSLRQ